MKNLKTFFVSLALCAPLTAAAQNIAINEENFPDENFRNWLLEQDYGADGVITEEEIARISEIHVFERSISSLKGIEHFTALTDLRCSRKQLTALDVSNNTALTWLACHVNQIKGEAMDALVNSLPETTRAWLYVYSENPDENEGNIITKLQVAAAKAKGWTPYYMPDDSWEWIEYEGIDDTATSIALPKIENGTAAVYTLHGQKVTTPKKGGIYIVDGKKVVVK